MQSEPLTGTRARVFVTDPDSPDDGRTFVWARTRWYERIEGEPGDVEFEPVADSEEDLRSWLSQEGLGDLTELDPNDEEFAQTVEQEYFEQSPLYPEAPELSNQPIISEEDMTL